MKNKIEKSPMEAVAALMVEMVNDAANGRPVFVEVGALSSSSQEMKTVTLFAVEDPAIAKATQVLWSKLMGVEYQYKDLETPGIQGRELNLEPPDEKVN